MMLVNMGRQSNQYIDRPAMLMHPKSILKTMREHPYRLMPHFQLSAKRYIIYANMMAVADVSIPYPEFSAIRI